MTFARIGLLEDLKPGQCRSVRVGIRRIMIWNVAGTLHAYEDACRHMKAPLSTGRLEGTTLVCSWHGWKYDVTTGACHDKSWGCLRRFPVKVEEGEILVSDEAIGHPEGDDGSDDEIPIPVFRS